MKRAVRSRAGRLLTVLMLASAAAFVLSPELGPAASAAVTSITPPSPSSGSASSPHAESAGSCSTHLPTRWTARADQSASVTETV